MILFLVALAAPARTRKREVFSAAPARHAFVNILCRQTRRWCSTLARARILDDGMVQCHWSDGSTGRFSLLWLRDHCPSKVHPDSGQRTVELRHIPSLSPAQIAVNEAGRTLDVNWPDAPSQSTFDSAWLWRQCADRRGTACATHNATVDSAATAAKVVPWSGAILRMPCLASVHGPSWCWRTRRNARRSSAGLPARTPTLRLRRCQRRPADIRSATEQLATRLGRVQDTFYGRSGTLHRVRWVRCSIRPTATSSCRYTPTAPTSRAAWAAALQLRRAGIRARELSARRLNAAGRCSWPQRSSSATTLPHLHSSAAWPCHLCTRRTSVGSA